MLVIAESDESSCRRFSFRKLLQFMGPGILMSIAYVVSRANRVGGGCGARYRVPLSFCLLGRARRPCGGLRGFAHGAGGPLQGLRGMVC